MNFSKREPAQPGWKSVFANQRHIPLIADSIAGDLRDWKYLKNLEQPEFAKKLSMTYVKLNHMHPFPEGNGRSTQTFLSQLALDAGYRLDFTKVAPTDWNTAAARSMPQVNLHEPSLKRPEDTRPIHRVFQTISVPVASRQIDKGLAPGRGLSPGNDR